MRLYADRLELSGWRLHGRYVRRIRLRQILQADVPDEELLLLWLSDGETLRLQVKDAQRWRDAIDGYLSRGQARCT